MSIFQRWVSKTHGRQCQHSSPGWTEMRQYCQPQHHIAIKNNISGLCNGEYKEAEHIRSYTNNKKKDVRTKNK
jgi:hypothetical protein